MLFALLRRHGTTPGSVTCEPSRWKHCDCAAASGARPEATRKKATALDRDDFMTISIVFLESEAQQQNFGSERESDRGTQQEFDKRRDIPFHDMASNALSEFLGYSFFSCPQCTTSPWEYRHRRRIFNFPFILPSRGHPLRRQYKCQIPDRVWASMKRSRLLNISNTILCLPE